ncbi:MAG: pre-peptidase C-terminal domain-containing protein [Chloroflexi bacterium]|nr:pre-peptidase C-terminal domain-containing protein [Chloroflexota bacterium]
MKSIYWLLTFVAIVLALLIGSVVVAPVSRAAPVAQAAPQNAQAAPDLIVEKIILNPANPTAGGTVDITPVIKNIGDGPAGSFRIEIFVEPTDDPPTTATQATHFIVYGLGLAPGDTFSGYTRTGQTVANANPKIYAWVDRDGKVAESNENNNLYPVPVTVTPDSFEEDDVCVSAKDIPNDGSVQNHNLARQNNADDEDWVKFNGDSGVTYVAQVKGIGADANPALELQASCDGQPSFGSSAVLTFTAPASGVYYLKVSNVTANYGAQNDYTVQVTAKLACNTATEPNDMCSLSGDVAAAAAAQNYSFCTQGDVDWMRLETKAGASYKITTTNVGSKADASLSLFASCEDANTETNGTLLRFTAAKTGYVYLKAQNTDPGKFGADTDYQVKVEYDGSQGCDEDSSEQDDVQANAKVLAPNGDPLHHNACPQGDLDWVKFTATQGTTYTVETLNLGTKADTVLCQYDANGAEIRCDDDSGAGAGSRLTLGNVAAGDYFFKVRDRDPEVAGPDTAYDVRVITGICQSDNAEPNNRQADAKALTVEGTPLQNNACASDDEDWFSFNATANTSYIIDANAKGPDGDTVLFLYDAGRNLLTNNDDHTPGIDSQIIYNVTAAGTYFVNVKMYNSTKIGSGTEYEISVRAGTATPTPTAGPTPAPTATPTPGGATDVRTLILVNRARIAQLYSDGEATQLMDKLSQLATQDKVKGEILRLDNNVEVSNKYSAWGADPTNVDKANDLAGEIRRVIMTYLQQRTGVEYVVLVGDDRALPFRRVVDNTPQQSENTYQHVSADNTIGAATHSNHFLTDDFYVDREPTPNNNREIYLPDLTVGRLIETPAEMMGIIDKYLANPRTQVGDVFVSGYDFVQDAASEDCEAWKTAVGVNRVACVIGPNWPKVQFTAQQLRTSPSSFKFQSISGHADHFAEGAAGGGFTSGDEIDASAIDLGGGLIYSLGCHGGLNVPPTNADHPMDLPQAFTRKGANYIGNTGYGWGLLNSVGLSEKMLRLLNRELLGGSATMGQALKIAKNKYFQQDHSISAYDEKVMQELVFYGLPMFEVNISLTANSAALTTHAEEFPGASVDFQPGSLGPNEDVISKTAHLDFSKVINPSNNDPGLASLGTESGSYLSFNGSISADAGQPVEPLFYYSLASQPSDIRSIILRTATYTTEVQADPLIGTPINEFVPRGAGDEATLDNSFGWYPPLPTEVRKLEGQTTLVVQLGQYQPATDQLRLFSGLDVDVVYSLSPDQTPPQVLVVDGLYNKDTGKVRVKAGVTDASGIKEVVLSYVENSSLAAATFKSLNLQFNAASQKWEGSFNGGPTSRFFIQALDQGGNVASATNKGNFFTPAQDRLGSTSSVSCIGGGSFCLYLPKIAR